MCSNSNSKPSHATVHSIVPRRGTALRRLAMCLAALALPVAAQQYGENQRFPASSLVAPAVDETADAKLVAVWVQLENATLIPPAASRRRVNTPMAKNLGGLVQLAPTGEFGRARGVNGPVGRSVCLGAVGPGQQTVARFDIRLANPKGVFTFFVDAWDRGQ